MKSNLMGGWFKATVTDKFLYITLIIAGLVAILGNETTLRVAAPAAGAAIVQLSAALLGIVIAGLAIFIVFLDRRYITLLKNITNLDRNIWPFKWVAILSVISLIFGMILILVGGPPVILFRIIIGFALWSYLYLLMEIFRLIKFLAGHLKIRVKQIETEDDDSK